MMAGTDRMAKRTLFLVFAFMRGVFQAFLDQNETGERVPSSTSQLLQSTNIIPLIQGVRTMEKPQGI